MSCKVSFIGLGVMGYPMAGFISKGGHDVTVYNRTKAKADKWISEYKGKVANTPSEAAKDSDFIFTSVGNDNDLREVAIGKDGLFNTAKKILSILIILLLQLKLRENYIKKQKIKNFIF